MKFQDTSYAPGIEENQVRLRQVRGFWERILREDVPSATPEGVWTFWETIEATG